MKSLIKWAIVACCPPIGFMKALSAASNEDPRQTVKQFSEAVPKAAKATMWVIWGLIILLAIGGVLWLKKKFFSR